MLIRILSCLYRPFILTIGTLLFLIINTYGLNNQSTQKEFDSLNILVQKSPTDTAKFKILSNFFWLHGKTNFPRYNNIGEWAYNIIKDSKNQRFLSDGYDIKGYILEREKKYDSAYSYFAKALTISKKIGYHSRITWSYYHLGFIHQSLGRYDSAIYYYKILIECNQEYGYTDGAFTMIMITANLYEEIKKPDSALLYYNKLLAYSQQLKDVKQEIYTDLAIANLYSHQNNTKKELETLNIALGLAEKSNFSQLIAEIYFYAGDLYFVRKKNLDLALLYYQKASDKCAADDKFSLATIHNEIARVYLAKGNDSLALKHTLTSISLGRSINNKHRVSEAYKTLGQIYSHQNKLNEAINCYSYCYNLGCDECPKIKFHPALFEIADAYLQLNNKPKALDYYSKSLILANKFKSPLEQALSSFKLGDFYRASNQILAAKYYKDAFGFANQSGNIRIIRDIADTLATVYKAKHDFNKVSEYLSLSKTLTDSINVIENQENMVEWSTRFEFERIKSENESKEKLSKLEIKRQKAYRNSALVVALLLLISGWVIWRGYKNKKKVIRQLEEQKKQIEEKNQEILAQVEEITSQKDEIERISDKLHKADEQKLRFFANVSHELRTPLTLIVSPLTKLLKGNVNGSAQKLYTVMLRNSRKLQELINQLLDISNIDKNELKLNLKLHDFNRQVRAIAAMFQSIAEEKNIEFIIKGIQENLVFCLMLNEWSK
jgi:signal transduction histidine kinase